MRIPTIGTTGGPCQLPQLCGGLCVLLVLGWSDLLHRHLFKSGLYVLCLGTCLMLLAYHAQPPASAPGLGWLGRMGRLSYELYLSHMFVVLGAEALYRTAFGAQQSWTCAVYLPMLMCCFALAHALEYLMARLKAGVRRCLH